ncbi:MAG: hypothetical protein LDL51_14330, partial [Chloroflexi bacterium]|nr:hypothetical protein [Chloroflexota bacterium]
GALRAAAREGLSRRKERLNQQIARDLEVLLQRDSVSSDSDKLRLLLNLTQGVRAGFDPRTHKQVKQVYTRFSYVFLAAQALEGREADAIKEDVMNHLDEAEEALRAALGRAEYERLSMNASRLADFGEAARILFGEDKLNEPLSSLTEEHRAKLIDAIGWYVLNEGHRQLLLSAFSELWVEYLTKVEALRVSIGLEAYAQRDPLVQYKAQASEMFQQLLEDVRALVIGRAFAARPRRVEISPVETSETTAAKPALQPQDGGASAVKKKRKRR